MRAADYGWLTVAAGVLAYEAHAAARLEWELLSEAADRYRRRHPVITDATISYIALHLLRAIPQRIDPLHRFAAWVSRA